MHEMILEKRETFGKKLAKHRLAGKLPVVVYGSGHKSGSFFVDLKNFKKLWKVAGESTLVSLKEDKKNYDVLIQDVAVHPLSGEPIHADFYAIDVNKPVEVKVALEFIGVSPAVKNLGALLVKVMHEIEIKVLPKNLVHQIEVDISSLANFGDSVHARDIKLPETAELLTNPDEAIALVKEIIEEKEEEVAPVDLTAIEVEKKGKEPKEGEENSETAPADKKEKEEKK
ncbi:MAG: 50S ribosomal protein L25 [Patescibacteria group bacterium]